MSDYEPAPSSKIGQLLAAMRASASTQPIWTSTNAAKVMGITRSQVPPYLVSALSHRLIFRRTTQDGIELSLQPFEVAPVGAQYERLTPAPMAAPRPGSDVQHPSGTAPKLCTGCSKSACWEKGCQNPAAEAAADAAAVASAPTPTPAPAPTAAPTPAPSPAPEIDPRFAAAHYGHDLYASGMPPAEASMHAQEALPQLVEEAAEEEIEPDAFLSCRTGEIILVGCPVDDEDRVTIPADLVTRIKAQVAWSPAR